MSRLWALLVALCAVGILLASPFLLGAIRAAQSSMAPPVLLTLQVLQTLLLCALAAYAGVRFAPAAGLDAPWLRVLAEGRSPPPAFGSMAIEAAAVGSITAVVVTALGLMLRASLPDALWRPASGGFWMRASSAFYGGIVEEILVRWGLLTAFVVVARRAGVSAPFWPANVIAALVFGALHFPSIALARRLQERDVHVTFIGTANGQEEKLIPQAGFRLETVEVEPIQDRFSWAALRSPVVVGRAIKTCRPLVKAANAVVGMR